MATYDSNMSRSGPGILLQHLTQADDEAIEAGIRVLAKLNADVVLLTDFDYDMDGAALAALRERLSQQGVTYLDVLALRPNTGIKTWLDMNHDGQYSGPRDAQAYGRFPGQAGMAILSRFPIDRTHIVSFTDMLWKDLPGADLPPDMTEPEKLLQRLSTAGHYVVPLKYGRDRTLNLLVYAATPPMFDGPEDRNGRRNADETNLWLRLLAGELPRIPGGGMYPPPRAPFILLGKPNLDPLHGSGRLKALRTLLASRYIRDTHPRNEGAHEDPDHDGDAGFHTAMIGKDETGMRLDVVLPSRSLRVLGTGVMWPLAQDPLAATLEEASNHRPVWVKLRLDDGTEGPGKTVRGGGLGSSGPGGGTPSGSDEDPVGGTVQGGPGGMDGVDPPDPVDSGTASADAGSGAASDGSADAGADAGAGAEPGGP